MGIFDDLVSITCDVVKIATAPVVVALDITKTITSTVAEAVEEVVKEIKD